jgi:DNA-binding NarL/FixJ family response regulator
VNHPISVNYNGCTKFHIPNICNSEGKKMASLLNLTSREIEILQLALTGRTNKAIATEVRITVKTVEFHLDLIYTKIGVRTRLLAGIWAMQHGIEIETREIPS